VRSRVGESVLCSFGFLPVPRSSWLARGIPETPGQESSKGYPLLVNQQVSRVLGFPDCSGPRRKPSRRLGRSQARASWVCLSITRCFTLCRSLEG